MATLNEIQELAWRREAMSTALYTLNKILAKISEPADLRDKPWNEPWSLPWDERVFLKADDYSVDVPVDLQPLIVNTLIERITVQLKEVDAELSKLGVEVEPLQRRSISRERHNDRVS